MPIRGRRLSPLKMSRTLPKPWSPVCVIFFTIDFEWAAPVFSRAKTKPQLLAQLGFRNLILTMTYSHMGKPHTTIGDASFHC
jgi:hypothetical protein